MRVPTGHLGKKTGASSGHKTNRNISRAGIALYSLTGRIRHAKWSAMGERRHMQHAKKKLWRDQTSTVGNTTPTVGRRCARKRPVAPRARAWAGTLSDFASKLTAGLSTARSGHTAPAGGAPCAGACRGLEVPASRRGAALGAERPPDAARRRRRRARRHGAQRPWKVSTAGPLGGISGWRRQTQGRRSRPAPC
ncbi:unnamed protein product [Prorocentrum cordatum]|uniref:50S ribosomal protein L35 n=1 Tax=Prorocentrum cordatum TaxID=2364126 RepID=A0ABN9XHL9_9DINO|nr:unnamed protein product [Polarella glacialis]